MRSHSAAFFFLLFLHNIYHAAGNQVSYDFSNHVLNGGVAGSSLGGKIGGSNIQQFLNNVMCDD